MSVLGDFVGLQRGNTYKSALLDQDGPFLLGLGSIAREGGFKGDKLKTYGGATNDKMLLFPGDVYVSLKDVTQSGDLLGAVARVPNDLGVGRLTQDTVKLLFNEKAPKSLIYWILRTPEYRAYCRQHATGTTNLGLSREDFLSFPIPEQTERQQNLVGALEALDEKMALNRKLNETLEGMAQALFQSWFVDFDPVKAKLAAVRQERDPERACMAALTGKLRVAPGKPKAETLDELLPSGEELDAAIAALQGLNASQLKNLNVTASHFPSGFEESELGLIPEGWKWVALYDTAEFVNGAAFKSADFTDTEEALPIIKIAELKQGITDQTKFTKEDVKERHRINNGDLLYSWSGSPGTSLEVFKWFGGEGWLNQHIFKINTSSNEQVVLVWLILKHLKPELIRIAENKQTTGLGHVTVADMKKLFVAWPDEASLKGFGNVTIPIYDEHSARILGNRTLAELCGTLLPRLLSGELTIGETEIKTDEVLV